MSPKPGPAAPRAPLLSDAQLRAALARCRTCEAKPCRTGCPAGCSPADFILAARGGAPSDLGRAAAHVLAHNPLGGACGQVCPDGLCMARCARRALDGPVDIPAIQAAIVARARALGVLPRSAPPPATGLRVAIVGAGPAGLGAASVLARAGHAVHLFDRARAPGGAARLIPRDRLDPAVLAADVEGILALGDVRLVLGRAVPLPRDLLTRGFAAVVVAAGLPEPVALDGLPGRERAIPWTDVLGRRPPALRGRRVAVVGDGGVALDCAGTAVALGAAHVELFARKALSELPLGRRERDRLLASGVHLTCRVRVTAIRGRGKRATGLALRKVTLPPGQAFHPSRLADLPHGAQERRDLDTVILALGGRSALRREPHPRILYAGDLETGPTSVVEAIAAGKRAGLAVHRRIAGEEAASCPDRAACPGGHGCPKAATCPEWNQQEAPGRPAPSHPPPGLPVPLDCDVLGRRLPSPFLLAASPFTEGYAQLRRAYEAGWAGAVLARTEREAAAGAGHERLRRDAERLRAEFPDRLTLASADGPFAGDAADHHEAAALLVGGAKAVLVDGSVRRHGLAILDDLRSGLSHLLAARGLPSVAALAGSANDGPAGGPAVAAVAAVEAARCAGCGNCTRCPHLAVSTDGRGVPAVDAGRCTGCGLCVEPCVAGAIALRPA